MTTRTRALRIFLASIALASCTTVDTAGLSADSSKGPHPQTNPNAAVTVVEYADLQCPACKSANDGMVLPMIEKYGMQIRYDYRQFPLESIHRHAMSAAQATECAADQGKFWEYVELTYANQKELSQQKLGAWAEELGLNMDSFTRCLDSGIKETAVRADQQEGESMGVRSTPTFFVNGKQVVASQLDQAIDEALSKIPKKL